MTIDFHEKKIKPSAACILLCAEKLLNTNLDKDEQFHELLVIKKEREKILEELSAVQAGLEDEQSLEIPVQGILIEDLAIGLRQGFMKARITEQVNVNIYPSGCRGLEIKVNPAVLKSILQLLINEIIEFVKEGDVDVFVRCNEQYIDKFYVDIDIVCSGNLDAIKINDLERSAQSVLIKNLVNLVSGRLSLKKQSSESVTITMTINAEASLIGGQEMPQTCFTSLQNKKCLIVDDNAQYAKVFATFLGNHNVEYDLADNGKIGLSFIEKNHYDFILMDLQMPVMDGFEAIQHIRSRHDYKRDIKVIAVTSYNDENIEEQCRNAGFTEYLSKPVTEPTLLGTIDSMLNNEAKPACKKEEEPATTGIEGIVDLSYLQSISNGDKEFEKDMIESSINDIEIKMNELVQRVAANDIPASSDCVHSLKSLFSIVGLTNLYNEFSTLDNLFNRQSSSIPIHNLGALQSEWNCGKSKLERILAEG